MPGELEEIRDRLREFAAARDWEQFHTPRNLALALCGEVGELAAELQWVPDGGVAEHLRDPAAFARLADEVADVMIYLVRFADVSGIDVMSAVSAKIERNETRFPSLLGRFCLTPSERQQGGKWLAWALACGPEAFHVTRYDRTPFGRPTKRFAASIASAA